MEHLERSIEVDVPIRTAYNQWTQFEEFPRFMPGVQRVWQLDDKRMRWRAELSGVAKEWDAEITEQLPDRHIAWGSTGGAQNRGSVRFEPIHENRSRVIVNLDYDPSGILENVGSTLGVVSRYVEEALAQFKTLIETREQESGGWRGEIHGGEVQPGGADHLQEATTAGSLEQTVGGTTNAGITGDQPLPDTGEPLPHAYGTGGDLDSQTPGATTGGAEDADSKSRMAQMSAGRTGQGAEEDIDAASRLAQMSGGSSGHGPEQDADTESRMAQMSGGRREHEAASAEGGGATDFRSEETGRTLPNSEGLVDSDIPSERERDQS